LPKRELVLPLEKGGGRDFMGDSFWFINMSAVLWFDSSKEKEEQG
jgi:hypothetical protein